MTKIESSRLRASQYDDGPPQRGISDLVALALVLLELDTVRRSTLRALCPLGERRRIASGGSVNVVSRQFVRALRNFEKTGWAQRDGSYLHVKDRAALRAFVDMGVDVNEERAQSLLSVKDAVSQINADLESGSAVSGWTAEQIRRDAEIRRRELIALKRLMESGPGASHSGGSRSVRIIPRGGVL